MAKNLNPKVDLTFKKVFGEHPNLVKSLLNALLPLPDGMTIEHVEMTSTFCSRQPHRLGNNDSFFFANFL